jgi:hypothetical protein
MRRIIERVVTVVTTTTWTISWQGDTSQAAPQADPVADDFPKPDVPHKKAKHIQKFSSVITTKEVDPAETKTDSTANEPPQDPHSHQSKIERK